MNVQITLKTGTQLNVEMDEIARITHPITNELTNLTWTSITGKPKLFFIRLEDIAAIVVVNPK